MFLQSRWPHNFQWQRWILGIAKYLAYLPQCNSIPNCALYCWNSKLCTSKYYICNCLNTQACVLIAIVWVGIVSLMQHGSNYRLVSQVWFMKLLN